MTSIDRPESNSGIASSADDLTYNHEHFWLKHFVADLLRTSQNLIDARVERGNWRLEVGGEVDNPRQYDFAAISALPSVVQESTLTCISNGVGGGLMSNAQWKGVPLRMLLEQSRPRGRGRDVDFHGVDGYADTFPLDKAMDVTTLVAYEMNGQPLPQRHGFPVRIIGPDLCGEKNVKWIDRIRLSATEEQGFYENQGWGPDFVVKTQSRFRPGLRPPAADGGGHVAGHGIRRRPGSDQGGGERRRRCQLAAGQDRLLRFPSYLEPVELPMDAQPARGAPPRRPGLRRHRRGADREGQDQRARRGDRASPGHGEDRVTDTVITGTQPSRPLSLRDERGGSSPATGSVGSDRPPQRTSACSTGRSGLSSTSDVVRAVMCWPWPGGASTAWGST
jgi:DMSO/TMAO reductase YedYZ molybdopterin-dependent catalytic subunit